MQLSTGAFRNSCEGGQRRGGGFYSVFVADYAVAHVFSMGNYTARVCLDGDCVCVCVCVFGGVCRSERCRCRCVVVVLRGNDDDDYDADDANSNKDLTKLN